MFGKGKRNASSNDKFIMSAGRKAGNLKAATVAPMKGQKPVTASPTYKARTIDTTARSFSQNKGRST